MNLKTCKKNTISVKKMPERKKKYQSVKKFHFFEISLSKFCGIFFLRCGIYFTLLVFFFTEMVFILRFSSSLEKQPNIQENN